MDRRLILRNARILTPLREIRHGELEIREGKVARVGPLQPASGGTPSIDLSDHWVTPGFIDLHVHGGSGAGFMSGEAESGRRAARFHARHGTTTLLASTVTASSEALIAAVAGIRVAAEDGPDANATILGIHLEGPFLSHKQRGIHDPRQLRNPSQQEMNRLFAAAGGRIRMVTLAPELPGAIDLIRMLVQSGVVAAIGHTNATYEEAVAGVMAGARHVIHTFNGMRPFHHRDPGVLAAALVSPELSCEVIADGVHVHPAAVDLLYASKGPASTVLVTDAVEVTGCPDGMYRSEEREIRVQGDRVELSDGSSLAGSTLTMDAAVRNAVSFLRTSLGVAVRMATLTPARVLRIDSRKGMLAEGYDADLVVLDARLQVVATMVAGRWIYGPYTTETQN